MHEGCNANFCSVLMLSSFFYFFLFETEAKLHFDIYDFDGVGKVDMSLLGDLIRSLDLRPTNAAVEKAGGTKKKGLCCIYK